MTPEIVTAQLEHIPLIAARVRPADREEIWAAACQSPEACLENSFRISHLAWTGLIDGVPVCMFGVVQASLLENKGRPWMIGTDLLDRHQVVFLRRCLKCVDTMQMVFHQLENWVDTRNTRTIRWLKWLGFEFDPPQPMGPYQVPFMRFSKDLKEIKWNI
jgi:hypothetical protein